MKDRFLSRVLRGLPFSPRGRRIVDETLHDREHEAASAHHGRWLVAARGIVGISRAVAFATALDLIQLPLGWLVGRLMVFAVLPAAVLVIVSVPFKDPRETFTLAQSLWMRVLMMPAMMQGLLPIAFFLAMAWPTARRPKSVIGVAVAAALVTFVTSGWLAPASREYLHQYWFQLWRVDHPDVRFVPMAGPLSIVALIRRAWADGAVVGQLPFIVGLPVMTAAFVCAALQVPMARNLWQRFGLLATVPVYFGALSLLGGSSGLTDGRPVFSASFTASELAVRLLFVAVASVWILRQLLRHSVLTMAALLLGGAVFLVLPNDWLHLYSVLLGGYAPWMLAAIALAFAWRGAPQRGSRPDVGVLGGRSVEHGLDERADRHDAPLMLTGPRNRGVDQLLGDPGSA